VLTQKKKLGQLIISKGLLLIQLLKYNKIKIIDIPLVPEQAGMLTKDFVHAESFRGEG